MIGDAGEQVGDEVIDAPLPLAEQGKETLHLLTHQGVFAVAWPPSATGHSDGAGGFFMKSAGWVGVWTPIYLPTVGELRDRQQPVAAGKARYREVLPSYIITLSLSRRLAGYFIGNGVAIANHASRRRCWAASHSRITLRCCSRSGDFAASRSRMDAWEASCIAAVSAGDTSIAKAALALKR
jgi:hypothetical protein